MVGYAAKANNSLRSLHADRMKVIFDCSVPFLFAHGGMQVQIEQTQLALEKVGVAVEPLRWWDGKQEGNILHYFGRISLGIIELAHRKGLKVVNNDLLGGAGARPAWRLKLQRLFKRAAEPLLPPYITTALNWTSHRQADACIALTAREAHLLNYLFRVPLDRIHVVPNGVEEVFLESSPAKRGEWLVCTATIIELKQVLKLAQVAVQAKTPLWIIGRPHLETDEYAGRFRDFARQHASLIRYEGPVAGRQQLADIYRQARGFILLSKWESLSLSALEASACECPLLLSDLPWARKFFKDKATYCPANKSIEATAPVLRDFYDKAPLLPLPPKPLSWVDVARQLKDVYLSVMKSTAGG